MNARWSLALALTLLAIPATSAERVAVRVRDDGRVDVRATSAPLAAVLDRLAALTPMKVAYQGPKPRRLVTLQISAANQAEAVLDILRIFGADYAASTDATGTRVLTLVVADADAPASGHRADPEPASEVARQPDGASPDAMPTSAVNPGSAGSDGATGSEGFPLLEGDYVPGGRATGQTTEWGAPEFVLPDPPGPKATDKPKATEGAAAPSEPGASQTETGSPSP